MKRVPVDSPLHRTLNSQQFALKLIANVTYGYASASFSGRMPNVHLADAIVQTGRETLQRTIEPVDARRRITSKEEDNLGLPRPPGREERSLLRLLGLLEHVPRPARRFRLVDLALRFLSEFQIFL